MCQRQILIVQILPLAFFIIHQPPLLSFSCLALHVIPSLLAWLWQLRLVTPYHHDKAPTTVQHNASFSADSQAVLCTFPGANIANKNIARNDDNRIFISLFVLSPPFRWASDLKAMKNANDSKWRNARKWIIERWREKCGGKKAASLWFDFDQ